MQLAIGAISGTSMDGIDVAVVRTDGRARVETGPGITVPWPEALRARLIALLSDPAVAEQDPLRQLEAEVTDAFIAAVRQLIEREGLARGAVDVVGLHGQTVLHRPERRFTRQLGDGARVAASLGIDTVAGFRLQDVAAGGQGAPFAPLYHAALAASLPHPVMLLNWGGVGNVTYVDGDTVIAFDTGPGSALIDDLVRSRLGLPFDEDGRIASGGAVDHEVLGKLLGHPFFVAPPPKSLDRQDFHALAAEVDGLATADAAATLAAFTVEATARALNHVPRAPAQWLVAGGGRHNASLMRGLERRLGARVEPVERQGWDGDRIEAQCFGYLAVRSVLGLPLSIPSTTGVPMPMPGGTLFVA